MVRFILALLLLPAYADIFGTSDVLTSKIPEVVKEIKALEMKTDVGYEESFNKLVRKVEIILEEEKLFCNGEVSSSDGKVIEKSQKQVCFRSLKTQYIKAMDEVFDLKKRYLKINHQAQTEKLTEIHQKLKADFEKSF